MRRACLLFVAACGSSPAPQATPQTVIVADAGHAAPIATTSSSAPPAPEPRRNGPTLKATAAMKTEGTLDDRQIVAAANEDSRGLQQCAVPVRSSDRATGSLNLQITVSANGEVRGELQSPASEDAKTCILDLVKTWKVRGTGKAMVLLSVVD